MITFLIAFGVFLGTLTICESDKEKEVQIAHVQGYDEGVNADGNYKSLYLNAYEEGKKESKQYTEEKAKYEAKVETAKKIAREYYGEHYTLGVLTDILNSLGDGGTTKNDLKVYNTNYIK